MKLDTKKALAGRVLNVGKKRIVFVPGRLSEIKEAITKQDIKDLKEAGAILVQPVQGRKTNTTRNNRRGPGKIKKKVNVRKETYMIMTRKLRAYVLGLRERGEISREDYYDLRKKIRNRYFSSLRNLKEYLGGKK